MRRKKLPTEVVVGSRSYPIDADFRTMIEIEDVLFGKNILDEQEAFAREIMQYTEMSHEDACMNARYYAAMDLFYKGNIPDDLGEAADKLLWFYSCGKEEPKGKKPKQPVLSFRHDFDYINAGFMQDYKIDLLEIDFLHWWKFMSLFSALHDDCKICEIMGWRGADVTKMDKEQKKRVREMQRIYALPKDIPEEEKERQDAITDALLHGGDVDAVLRSGQA